MGNDFIETSRSVVRVGPVVTVTERTLRTPDGDQIEREVVEHPGAVVVAAVDAEGRIVMVRQHRVAVGGTLLELPAGKLDIEGEALEVAARRELLEETGLVAEHVTPLADVHNSPGFCDEVCHLFVATELRQETLAPDGAEEQHMTIERHSLADALAMVADGRITDAKTMVGVLMLGRGHGAAG